MKIRATQGGYNNYKAAPAAEQSFAVEKAAATLNVTKTTQVYSGTVRGWRSRPARPGCPA